MKFRCKCGYRFEAEQAYSCPYCGEEKVTKEKDASKLIEETETFKREE